MEVEDTKFELNGESDIDGKNLAEIGTEVMLIGILVRHRIRIRAKLVVLPME
jgi:hypothetical protein